MFFLKHVQKMHELSSKAEAAQNFHAAPGGKQSLPIPPKAGLLSRPRRLSAGRGVKVLRCRRWKNLPWAAKSFRFSPPNRHK
jgi:hypothetical protein